MQGIISVASYIAVTVDGMSPAQFQLGLTTWEGEDRKLNCAEKY